jgi:DNA-binding response OmpR family regulator
MTLRVLLIEDDAAIRKLFTRVLAPHVVVACATGEEGVAALAGDVADVVVCDLGLPGMSGVRVVEQVRADARWHKVPILVISGRTAMHDHALALEAGADLFLPKPVGAKDVVHAVETLARERT